MTLPPIDPETTTSGISVDPVTLDRVVAATRRPDGSLRKEIKIRPGFTPQEDVGRFRTQRQQVADARKAGPRVVPGWAPPAQPAKKPPKPKSETGTTSKSGPGAQKKTDKAKAKEKEKAPVKDSWEDDDDDDKEKLKKSDTASSKPDQDSAEADPTGQKDSDAVDLLAKEIAAVTVSDS
ncbi:hypothetical protein FRC04_000596 [Tulasnella sp. 424]|nr:hypothetical protein FRC04_000596 [Tulasnella sp. 424]KAG8967887.1 hypothetical protein FRC05_001852 [Tulasnella sp. 425]